MATGRELLLEGIFQQAHVAWSHRDQPGQTERAIELWEQIIQTEPSRGDLYISLTKACGRAYRHAKSSKERRRWADRGRHYGELAVSKNRDNANAYAEYSAAIGQWAAAHKGMHSLSAVRQAIHILEKGLTLDPHHATSHMLLAAYYLESPGWPISVGDKKKALDHAQRAVEYDPSYAIHHLILARVYLALRQKGEARKELETILSLSPPPDAIPETKTNQEDARDLLKSL